MLGRIKKSFARFDRKFFRSLYLNFVRALVEFAVPVWFPILKSECDNIERIQHRATKILSSIRHLPYESRLKALDLTTLVERRKRGDLIQIHKIVHNIDKVVKVCSAFIRLGLYCTEEYTHWSSECRKTSLVSSQYRNCVGFQKNVKLTKKRKKMLEAHRIRKTLRRKERQLEKSVTLK